MDREQKIFLLNSLKEGNLDLSALIEPTIQEQLTKLTVIELKILLLVIRGKDIVTLNDLLKPMDCKTTSHFLQLIYEALHVRAIGYCNTVKIDPETLNAIYCRPLLESITQYNYGNAKQTINL